MIAIFVGNYWGLHILADILAASQECEMPDDGTLWKQTDCGFEHEAKNQVGSINICMELHL